MITFREYLIMEAEEEEKKKPKPKEPDAPEEGEEEVEKDPDDDVVESLRAILNTVDGGLIDLEKKVKELSEGGNYAEFSKDIEAIISSELKQKVDEALYTITHK